MDLIKFQSRTVVKKITVSLKNSVLNQVFSVDRWMLFSKRHSVFNITPDAEISDLIEKVVNATLDMGTPEMCSFIKNRKF